jgi:hypothetical protein
MRRCSAGIAHHYTTPTGSRQITEQPSPGLGAQTSLVFLAFNPALGILQGLCAALLSPHQTSNRGETAEKTGQAESPDENLKDSRESRLLQRKPQP